MVNLSTERLVLRELVSEDAPAVHEYASDPEVVKFMAWGPNTEEQTEAFIVQQIAARIQEPRLSYGFAVALRTETQVIGSCGLRLPSDTARRGWIGYCLARRFWGRGYATEAARALLGLGFGELGLHRIFATCDVGNVASARVLEKVGMRREACLREDQCLRGQWRDSYVYGILEHEWPRTYPDSGEDSP